MKYNSAGFIDVPSSPELREKIFFWASKHKHCAIVNGNSYPYPRQPFPLMVAAGSKAYVKAETGDAFGQLKDFLDQHKDYCFGFLGYDLKNELEDLSSRNAGSITFPDLFFFVPEYIFLWNDDKILIKGNDVEEILREIENEQGLPDINSDAITIRNGTSKEAYIANVARIKELISEGEFYEMNYCMDFYADNVSLSPLATYLRLCKASPMPFSAFVRTGDKYIISASPERFLKKEGQQLVSQPIKGTSPRGADDSSDIELRRLLANSPKEQAENLMIVDLVRNDLARSSVAGTTQVEELFGIYTFPQVHQMISTVVSQMRKELHPVEAIKNAFPMGSMTGAPKISSMQYIDRLETFRRNIFSGAIGYFTPERDFDFNVVIRSLFYDETQKKLSFMAGSAITYDCDAAQEYDECLLKTKALKVVLGSE